MKKIIMLMTIFLLVAGIDFNSASLSQAAGSETDPARITKAEALKKDVQKKKDYTDQEIQDFMKNYIEQQVKFTGSLMLYDEEREVMRNLKMNELKQEVRRMGIFYSSRGVFEDIDTGDILGVDVAIQNKDGQLELKALRIRSFKKGKQ